MTGTMQGERPDTRDMVLIHDVFRREFGQLPGLVRGVDDADVGRAEVLCGHYQLMHEFLHLHHTGEDVLLWPLLHERAPEAAALVARMQAQHGRLGELLEAAGARVPAWAAAPDRAGDESTAALLDELRSAVTQHLAEEEAEVLPLAERTLTVSEWLAIGAHSRAMLPPEHAFLVLGLILEDAPPPAVEAILGAMPAEATAAWETVGRAQYDAYIRAVRG